MRSVTSQRELKDLQPRLEQTAKDVDDVMQHIIADRSEASVTQKVVAQQELEANAQAARVGPRLHALELCAMFPLLSDLNSLHITVSLTPPLPSSHTVRTHWQTNTYVFCVCLDRGT
jgi:hypothetical protein